ncbi:MAG: hypothetical protein LKK21_02920 [Prevotella sp.]|nr:hypothetical protein [Prevotella sp.]MCI1685752.1 hypothetical protein [Prevotella sp.]MCI1802436.1 hypothetical protein [Prevotella sp.]MCI1816295.1 hypothetical protein [Prevotella sp.]MCI1848116.1 hypothetical protein [Prevotella sp.]MCI2087242.1 hypothetical protein [Prevotella sp.]
MIIFAIRIVSDRGREAECPGMMTNCSGTDGVPSAHIGTGFPAGVFALTR